ncbi:mechanosensitive ion channel family protein [Actinomadura rupiterrae]|uniref:mechanosensitive ion channel family protein n=1 Tax=Actinomadura rupiterrae TaxID=559627 RepID=UPI0020A39146|nr:mechanosensitive ion channel domain-containing protein [Actinomadura rupiterrae]MCP2341198.1 small-conductance mechanosensitive channel [Actinomadura rupiterrae]
MSAFWALIVPLLAVALSVGVVEGARRLLAGRLSARWPAAGAAARRCTAPAFAFAAAISAAGAVPYGDLPHRLAADLRHLLHVVATAATAWLVLRIFYALTDPPLDRLTRVSGERNRRARRARTQMLLLRRIGAVVLVVIAVAVALFTFPAVRALGAGVLASAGVAGLVVGIAARPTLGNLLAGLQLAFSDALRLDDVVVVEGQWGRIEELTLSYVVVCLWDERRLILPVSYFIEQPFENWTRHTSRVVGAVVLRVDWSVPIEELRTVLHDYLREHPLWDQRDWVLQLTDVLPSGLVEMRALMSAADSASAWDLRCDAREHLVRYLRDHHPEALPRFRAEIPEETRVREGGGPAEPAGESVRDTESSGAPAVGPDAPPPEDPRPASASGTANGHLGRAGGDGRR